MTREAIAKLSAKCAETLELYHSYAVGDGVRQLPGDAARYHERIRGYLRALADTGVISQFEVRVLCAWYAHRRPQINREDPT